MAPDTRTTQTPILLALAAFPLGPFETNCYVVRIPGATDCWIVDPGFEPGEVVEHIKSQGLRPQAILLTHAHADHIAGIDVCRRAFPAVPVLLHEAEAAWLGDPMLNLSMMTGMPYSTRDADRLLRDGDTLSLAGTSWSVLHTPGHSPGSVTFHHAESSTALVGDALFKGSVGRTDFPGSDFDTLAAAIRTRLYTLPDATTIHPGHGPTSTVGAEKRSNPYVRP